MPALIDRSITPLSKQTKTRTSLIAFLNNLIEEGVAKIATYSTVWNRDAKANVITAVTDQALSDGRHNWAKMGGLSRFIVFSYSYSISTVTEILARYSEDGLNPKTAKAKLPRAKQVDIKLSIELADKLNPVAMKIGEQFRLYGFRAKINFRSLPKCIAHRNGRREVTEADFHEFLELAEHMNFDYNPI